MLPKEHREIVVRTIFGKLRLDSPRWYGCRQCTPTQARSSRSPLALLFAERAAPELVYLETKFASLISYGLAVDILRELLPIGGEMNATTVRRDQQRFARRLEDELGDEEASAVVGSPRGWAALPPPEAPLIVGLDGGYVRARDGAERKAGTFEVVVGKTFSDDRSPNSLAFVNGHDVRRRRRVHQSLVAQGMQFNQRVTFMSDGGDTVRDLQLYLTPEGEHILEWFHITMKLTVMKQMLTGLKTTSAPESVQTLDEVAASLERIKHFLWQGNTFHALEVIDDLESSVGDLALEWPEAKSIRKALREFETYVRLNASFIPNYGDRYRHGEPVSTAFAESAVNHVISKRFVKKQQMRWTRQGAHLLLQTRTRVLNDELRTQFEVWYPGMGVNRENAA